MKTKERDIKYCGVREDIIKTKRPDFRDDRLIMLYEYIVGRYTIHLNRDYYKREVYQDVENPVFQEYKFTNVRREHDRTTKWLIDNISNNENISYTDKIYKSIIFRLYNRIETAELIELSREDFFVSDVFMNRELNWIVKCYDRFKQMKDGYRIYTSVYKTGGTNTGLQSMFPDDPRYMCPLLLINKLIKEDFVSQLDLCETQLDVFNLLTSIKGIGKFIGYQLYVDLTYIDEFKFSENEFTIAGPGCHYGIELLLKDRKDFNGMKAEEIVFWMRDNLGEEFKRLNLEWNPEKLFIDLPYYDRCLNVMSLENIMCEFQKYVRANSLDMSNPRMRYRPFVYENPFKEI